MTEAPAIEIRNLHYRYPDGTFALRGVNCAIEQNACVGLIGPNGAGKSTLLLHFNGLLPDGVNKDEGEVLIDGQSLKNADPKLLRQIRREVGFVFQDPNDQLFCPTVYEDVAFGPTQLGLPPEELKTRVQTALNAVGLSGFENRMPHHLSGGEKRRVCIAGVLACNPKILILDEPTSNLDPKGRRELKALLKTIPITKIIATHDLELVVELCPQSLLMAGGQIIAHEDTKTLLSNEPLMLEHGLEKPHILAHLHHHHSHQSI